MRKRNLILPLFLGSFFITSNVDSAVFELYDKQNNNLLIAGGDCGGGGGGGGMSPKARAEEEAKRQKSKDAAKKRIIKSKIAAGKPLTDEEKKIIELNPNDFPLIDEIIGGGPNSLAPMKKQKSTIINDYREAIEYNKTDNKLGSAVPLRELRKKVLNLKKKINEIQYKEGDFFEFIDTQYASLYKLDLIESHIILLMSELKKFDDVASRKIPFDKYSPNIKEVEKQQKVLEGLDIQSDKYLSSLNLDFIGLRSLYSRSTLKKMKMLKGTNNQSDDSGSAEAWNKFMKRENER